MPQDQLPVPLQGAPLAPLGRVLSIGQILTVLVEIAKVAGPLFTAQNALASRVGVLVGDYAVEIPLVGRLDPWIADLLTSDPHIVRKPQEEGVLSHGEHDSVDDSLHWVSFYSMLRNIIFSMSHALKSNNEAFAPYFHVGEHGFQWSYLADPNDLTTDRIRGDVIHVLGAIAGLLSVNTRIPYAQFSEETIDKRPTTFADPEVSWNGSLADLILGQDTELLTRSEVIINANTAETV